MTRKTKTKTAEDIDLSMLPTPPDGLTDDEIAGYFGFHKVAGRMEKILGRSAPGVCSITPSNSFKVRFYRNDVLLDYPSELFARVDVDLVDCLIDIDVRDRADGSVMKDLLVKNVERIDIQTNPDGDGPTVSYCVAHLLHHKLSFDYDSSEPLQHSMQFLFSDFKVY